MPLTGVKLPNIWKEGFGVKKSPCPAIPEKGALSRLYTGHYRENWIFDSEHPLLGWNHPPRDTPGVPHPPKKGPNMRKNFTNQYRTYSSQWEEFGPVSEEEKFGPQGPHGQTWGEWRVGRGAYHLSRMAHGPKRKTWKRSNRSSGVFQ